LEAEQAKLAREAMERPPATQFDHGRSVGMYAGIAHVRDMIVNALDTCSTT